MFNIVCDHLPPYDPNHKIWMLEKGDTTLPVFVENGYAVFPINSLAEVLDVSPDQASLFDTFLRDFPDGTVRDATLAVPLSTIARLANQ